MVSLDPDDFLAGLADDPDYPSRPFQATENLAEEEELEWLSNKDVFPAIETCMLTEEPPKKAVANAEQGNPVSVSVVKASIGGGGALLLPPMPSRKTKDESVKVKSMRVCAYCGVTQTPQWPEGPLGICNACGFSYKSGRLCTEDSPKVQSIKSDKVNGIKSDKVKTVKRKCTHCGITQTPQWRLGPLGPQTLCNACGVRYKSGRLCPEYRPVNSPTFSQELHSNKHRKVMEIRKQIYGNEGTVVKPVDKCTNSAATTALEKMKKDMFPTVATVEQPRRSVIDEQQSPVSVLENSTNSSITLKPHQPPSKFLREQQLFCNQPNNKHNQEDTASVEIKRNIIFMSSCGTLELPYKAPSEVLGQQQLFSCQTTSKRRKKNIVEMKNEGNNATLTSSCGNLEPPHQVPSQFLEQHQPNNKCNKKHTAKVEMTMKPVDICSTTLMKSKKDSLPAIETLNILEHSRGIFIAEHQSPVVGIAVNCQNCGAEQSPQWWEGPLGPKTICLSCGLAKYTGRRKRSMSLVSNKKRKKEDIAKVEMAVKPGDKCTNSTTALMNSKKDPLPAVGTSNISEQPSVIVIAEQQSPASVFENSISSSMMLMSSSGTVNLHNQAPSEFPPQNQFCDQANNKPKVKDTTTVEFEGNSSTLMRSSGALEPLHQAPNEFLDQQQQAKNKPNKKDTAKVENGSSTTLMSSCGTNKLPHQAQSEFLGQQQLFCNQANNGTKKENNAKGESEGKCQNCGVEQTPSWLGSPLGPKPLCHACRLAKCTAGQQRSIAVEVGKLACPSPATGEFTNSTCTFPVLEEFHLSQKPSDIANAEQQKPFSVVESSTNNSIALMSSCRIKIPHRARSKVLRRRRSTIPGQQVGVGKNCMQCGKQTNRWRMGPLGPTTLCNACGNKYQPLWGRSGITVDIAKNCQHCGSEETTQLLLCPLGPKTLCTVCYHWFKASAEVEIERKCQHCGAEKTPLWRSGPLGSKTLCNACGLRWYKFRDLCRDRSASSPTLLRELHSNCYRNVLI